MNAIEQIKAERERCDISADEALLIDKWTLALKRTGTIEGLNFALSVLDKRKGSEICWDMLRLVEEFPYHLRLIFRLRFIEQKTIALISEDSGYPNEHVTDYIHEIEKRLDESDVFK